MSHLYSTLNFGLGEDVDMLRDAVYEFAKGEIAPLAEKVDRDNAFPNELWAKFGDMGLLGVTVAEEYGGVNMGYLAHVVAMEEISRASASIGLSYGAISPLANSYTASRSISTSSPSPKLRVEYRWLMCLCP